MRRGLCVVYNGYTGENVDLVRKNCECGHALTFLRNHPKICTHCGRMVYPTKVCEFKEKLRKEFIKNHE